jgi:crotonobetaine/carnitine-CoA ligase
MDAEHARRSTSLLNESTDGAGAPQTVPVVAGGALDPFVGRNVAWLLRHRRDSHPERECLVWWPLDGVPKRWTYAQVVDEVEATAGAMMDRGIAPGDYVCIHMENSPDFVFTWLAALLFGAVTVTTNTRSSVDELTYFLDKSGAMAVITDEERLPVVKQALHRATGVRLLVTATDGPVLDQDVPEAVEVMTVRDLRSGPARPELAYPRSGAAAGVQFTSGTTARPKGVVWTQSNFLWGAKVSAAHQQMTGADRTLTYLPLFHTNAQIYCVMATLWVGGAVVLLPRFSRRLFWPAATEERATFASMIPFAVRALLDDPVPDHHFRAWGNGLFVPRWDEYFGVSTLTWWGMTETVSHPVISELGLPARQFAMGLPATEYQVRIIGDDGRALDGEGQGLIEVLGMRGVSVALGYLDDEAANAAAWTENGWLRTGDRVERHEDGWLSFVEREKDMLRVGAENVAAQEVERVVGAVRGVLEVAVVAGPDKMLDEVPVAFVLGTADAPDDLSQQIMERCRDRLADFKVPRAVFVVDELPRSTLEKVAKNRLREQAKELLGEGAEQ